MLRKTEAIVLNIRKFGDTSLITTLYTREYGRCNFIIKGYRSTRAKKRHSYFQPLSIIDVVFYHKDSRELQLISESANRYFYQSLQTDPVKITLGMVVAEVFMPFFRSGIFARHGILNFWIEFFLWFFWIVGMTYYVFNAIRRLEAEARGEVSTASESKERLSGSVAGASA